MSSGIYHKESGSGEPLVLLHGLFGSLENLGGIARYLAKDYRVFSLDLPNHGRSEHFDECTLEQFVERVVQWLAELELERVHLLGHSLGGKVAMEVALKYPEKVNKLVVIDIAPVRYVSRHDQIFDGLLSLDLTRISSRPDADVKLTPYVDELAIRSFLLKNLYKDADDRFSWRMNLQAIHKNYSHLIRENVDAEYSAPVLFMKGASSDYIQEEYKGDILKRFPRAELKIISDTAHWLHAEKPELTANMVRRFLRV